MNSTMILYPAIAMFALSFSLIIWLGISRYRAVQQGTVRLSFYRTYDKGTQPERLHLLGRHIQNHFEVPPFFYFGVLFTYVSGSVSLPAVIFAWLFVIARCVHSIIHLGPNNVSHRFFVFCTSLLFLLGLWLSFLDSVVASAA